MAIEIELKFKVRNLDNLWKKLKGAEPNILYIHDEVFGKKRIDYKIRKRTEISAKGINVEHQRTIPVKNKDKTKKIIEETINRLPNSFKSENSYEKIRFLFKRGGCEVSVDFYPIGVYCEIEGNEKKIKKLAKKLGFDLEKSIKKNVDLIYCDWCKKRNRKPRLHWGFGKI